jgi:hypothetical protein
VLTRPNGPRKGYHLVADMLPEDAAAIAEMVDVYGADRVRKAVQS